MISEWTSILNVVCPFLFGREQTMAKYKTYDYSQDILIPVSLEEQLMPGTWLKR